MKNAFSANKNTIITAVVIIALGLFAWWYFGGSSSSDDSLLSSTAVGSGGDSLLTTLNQLKSLSLDQAIFSNTSFESLTDDTVTLPQESVGRPDPFAPVQGVVVAGMPATTLISATTTKH